jgi:hypothetical protein
MLGAGTQENPFIIQTPADLNAIRNNLSAYYELANDIDLSSFGNWTPIDNFNGQIDGKGHKILNLKIPTGFSYAGFIGNTNKTFTIKNLGFENINITSENYNAGALVSFTSGTNVLIENCYVKNGTISAKGYAGGLIGNLRGTATVRNCFAILDRIYAIQYRSAGFIGALLNGHTIENCYAVTYDLSSANATERYGFSYYNGNSVVNNCYWDKEVSGVTQSSYGTGKTTAEMKQQSTYVGWDFTNIWGINGDYPYLQLFGTPARQPQQVSVTIQSYINPIHSKTSKINKSTKQTQSFLNAIQTLSERHTATKRIISTFTLPIETSVQKSNRTVRRGIENVNTYINPVASIVERKTNKMKQLLSYVDKIKTNVNVIAPIKNTPVNAHVSVIENPSNIHFEENISNAYAIENPSFLEVIE